jgi:hypothetical protein
MNEQRVVLLGMLYLVAKLLEVPPDCLWEPWVWGNLLELHTNCG